MARAKVEKIEQKDNIDIKQIENNLKVYVDEEIKKELDKSNKRLIREKNKKILFRNIIIMILIIIVIFLLYLLNSVDYFDKFFIEKVEKEEKIEETVKETEPTLDELKEQYAYLLDNIIISEKSDYIEDYYKGNLTKELKNYIALNTIKLDTLKEDDYTLIDNSILKETYEKIFNDEYTSTSFKYNGKDIRYITKLESYITDEIITNNKTNIKREIVNISVKDKISITTIEGLVKENKLYNIETKESIGEYKNNLKEYKDKLNTITYVFDDSKLLEIK